MEVEIRAARLDEIEEFRRVANTALLVPVSENLRPEMTLCAFEDGKLTTSYAAWEMTMRINGADIPLAGVTMVGTLPVYRRRGYLRKITETHFEKLYNEGERPIAALHPSRTAIYQRYGYAVVLTRNTYNIEPRYLEFAHSQKTTGSFREADEDDMGTLDAIHQRFIADRTGYLHRTKDMWDSSVLFPPRERGLLSKVIYEEDGKPLGYVIYTTEPSREPRRGLYRDLAVRELNWLSAPAYQAIWEYFKQMDLAYSISWRQVPADDPLPHLLIEPGMLNTASYGAMMARIVDIERALEKRVFSTEGKLTFEIIDKLCPWNNGRWKLETSIDGCSVSRSDEDPQLVMPVSTMAMLYFGQLSATEASRMGRLDILQPDALSSWDKIMSTRYKPAENDFF
jgi:predicted acetyltransferase